MGTFYSFRNWRLAGITSVEQTVFEHSFAPGIVLDAGDTAVNETDNNLGP